MTQEKHLECSHRTSNSVYDEISDDLEKSKNKSTSNKVNDECNNFHSVERNVRLDATDEAKKTLKGDSSSKIDVFNFTGDDTKMTVKTHPNSSENIREIQTKISGSLKNVENSEIYNNPEVEQSKNCELKTANEKLSECKHSDNGDGPDVNNKGGRRRPSHNKIHEDPFARLNALRANISNALKEVKAVLIEHGEPLDIGQEKMKPAEENIIRFRFVKRIRKKSLFDEDDNTDKTQEFSSTEKANQLNMGNSQLDIKEASASSETNTAKCDGKSIAAKLTKLVKATEKEVDNLQNMKMTNKDELTASEVLDKTATILSFPPRRNNGDKSETPLKEKFKNMPYSYGAKKSNEEIMITNHKKDESENINSQKNESNSKDTDKLESLLEEKSICKKKANEIKKETSNQKPSEKVKKTHIEHSRKENQGIKSFSKTVLSRKTDFVDQDVTPKQSSDTRSTAGSVEMKNNTELIGAAGECIKQNASVSSSLENSAPCKELDLKLNENFFNTLDEKTALTLAALEVSSKHFNENPKDLFTVIVGVNKNLKNSNDGNATIQDPRLAKKLADLRGGSAPVGKSTDGYKQKDEVHQKPNVSQVHPPKEFSKRPIELIAKQSIALEKVLVPDNLKPKLFSQTLNVGHLKMKKAPKTRCSSLAVSVLPNLAKTAEAGVSPESKDKINLSTMKNEENLEAIIASQNKVGSAAGDKTSDRIIKSSQKELVDKVHCPLKIETSKIGAVAIKPTLTLLPSPAKAVQLMLSKSITVSVPQPVEVLIMDIRPNTKKLATWVIDESDSVLKKKSVQSSKETILLQADLSTPKESDWLTTETKSTEHNEKVGEDLNRENKMEFENNDIASNGLHSTNENCIPEAHSKSGDSLKNKSAGKKSKIKKKVVIKRIKRRLSVDTSVPGKQDSIESAVPEICEKEIDVKTVEGDSQKQGEQEPDEQEQEKHLAGPKSCLKIREYAPGQLVMYADSLRKTVKWKKATVVEKVTSISYKLNVEGKEKSCHICYIKKYTDKKVHFGGKEYLEIDYAQDEEENQEEEEPYNIWARV